jgi:hypothetical protein
MATDAANRSLIGVRDGVVNKPPPQSGGATERKRTMTGYTALTNHTYVVTYQAELRSELHRTGASRDRLEAINRLAERWLTRTGTLRATRGVVTTSQMR